MKNLLELRDVILPQKIKQYRKVNDTYNIKLAELELLQVTNKIKRRKKNWDDKVKSESKWEFTI